MPIAELKRSGECGRFGDVHRLIGNHEVGRVDLKDRTKAFARRVLRLIQELPKDRSGWIIGDQLGRSGTAVGANYRAACRARSGAEFVAKLGIVVEEADESAYWLELIMEEGILPAERVKPLWQEADELVAIMTASRRTAEENRERGK